MVYLIQVIKARLLLHSNNVLIITLFIVLITFSSCLVKHYEFQLLDKKGNEIVLYGDSVRHITLRGTLTPFNDVIGAKDYHRNEDVKLYYEIKGFDTINVISAKIRLWRLGVDSTIAIKNGKILYDWNSNDYTLTKQIAIKDTIGIFEDVYENPQIKNYFIIVESDTNITDGLESVVVESDIIFLSNNESISFIRKDTLWRDETIQYQLRSH